MTLLFAPTLTGPPVTRMPVPSSAWVWDVWSTRLTLSVRPNAPDATPDWAMLIEPRVSFDATVSPPPVPVPVWTSTPPSIRAVVVLSTDWMRVEPPAPAQPAWLPNGEIGPNRDRTPAG